MVKFLSIFKTGKIILATSCPGHVPAEPPVSLVPDTAHGHGCCCSKAVVRRELWVLQTPFSSPTKGQPPLDVHMYHLQDSSSLKTSQTRSPISKH